MFLVRNLTCVRVSVAVSECLSPFTYDCRRVSVSVAVYACLSLYASSRECAH